MSEKEINAISRRVFAFGCGALAVMGALTGCTDNPGKRAGHLPSESQYGFWFETSRCIGCVFCEEACRKASATPEGAPSRRHIVLYRFADGRERFISYSCMHCAEPACVRVCPAGAISKGGGGAVLVDKERCIGCRYCHQACPYHVPGYLPSGMDKCDLCLGSGVALGDTPPCAAACPTSALHYGLLANLTTQARSASIASPGNPSFVIT